MKNPFLNYSPEIRIAKIAALVLEEFQRIISKRGMSEWTAGEIIAGFQYLKLRMKELNLSKQKLMELGCDYEAYKNLYFSAAPKRSAESQIKLW